MSETFRVSLGLVFLQMRGHPTGGEWEEHLGPDPHSLGSPPEGASGQDHSDHCLLAGQPAVTAPQPPCTASVIMTKGCGGRACIGRLSLDFLEREKGQRKADTDFSSGI